jgi:hypothetical protein
MTTTIYKAPPGMVMMAEADVAELERFRAKSPFVNDNLPPYGKWVLVKHGKNGRVIIAKRVRRQEVRVGGKLIGICMFETRNHESLIGINLWMEIPK